MFNVRFEYFDCDTIYFSFLVDKSSGTVKICDLILKRLNFTIQLF